MSAGRSLDEELERQLAGATIPEDDVDLFDDPGALGQDDPNPPVTSFAESSPDWSLIGHTEPATSGGTTSILHGKSLGSAKKFSVRLLDPSLFDFCLKFVGNGSSICVVEGCKTNHSGSSGPLKLEGPMVVIMKTKDRAFPDLMLDGTLVPPEVLQIWESTSRTLKDWHEAFLVVDLQDESDFDTRVLEVQRAKDFKTPAKKRQSGTDGLGSFVPYPPALRSTAIKDSLKRSPLTFTKLGETVVAMDEGLAGLAGSFQAMITESRDLASGFAETSKMLSLKISRTQNSIGSMDVLSGSDYAAPTVWSSLSAMGADVQLLLTKIVPAPVVDLKPLQNRLSGVESDIKAGSDKIKQQVVSLAGSLSGRIGRIESAIKRLNSKSVGNGGTQMDAATEARIQSLEKMLQDMDARVCKVTADGEAEAIKFGGLGLRSEVETRAWIVSNYSEMHYALVFDVYGVLEAIEDEGATNQSDLLRDMKKRDDLSINGIAEGQALTSHLHEIPRIFHAVNGKLSSLDNNESHLNKVPSYKHWSHGTHCLKRRIENELVKVRYSNRLIIQNHFTPGTMAYSVASEALDKSITWVTGLISFMDRTYDSLHGGSRFTTSQAWSLTTQLVRRIFSDLHTLPAWGPLAQWARIEW